ncbi:hypothetical protein [Legionella tunisiensis]|uniref:hypothetical protein n=1 Tax=Legionella tunisiensis TaxID=1034944 RepID=UPI00030FA323|nr:hypothetical protein [Legionella tunisiensis]
MSSFFGLKNSNQKLVFYTPVFEVIDPGHDLSEYNSWRWIESGNVYRNFYQSRADLQEDTKAHGCYKITLAASEIGGSLSGVDLRNKCHTLALALSAKKIISYIAKNGTEYDNPFYEQGYEQSSIPTP